MLKLYNSLTKNIEEFRPIEDKKVGMYTCGPTVYDYPTIGNYKTYTLADLLFRVLKYLDYDVKHVMNLTDVGHLTGDNSGDADTGEDRLEKASRREGKTAWEVAKFYSDDFKDSFSKLNLKRPDNLVSATDHISEQIELVKQLEDKKLTYKTDDGVYFDVMEYESQGHKYGQLSTLDQIKEGARVEPNPQKKDPRDFALWKFSPKDEKRDMEWESPWGLGFPGWHIECSAMSMKYLGEQFDLHVGGEDLKSTHHPNEIAQSEGATGKQFVKYWVHGAFLTVDGGRMGKSLGNAYTLHDLNKRSFSPLDLRYFYLTGHYRKQLNFTWEALESAHNALKKLYMHAAEWNIEADGKGIISENYKNKFIAAISDDLNTPQSLAVVWEMVKDSGISNADKLASLLDFDNILGLDIKNNLSKNQKISEEAKVLIEIRNKLREEKKYEQADKIRQKLSEMGYEIQDK